MLEQSLGDIDTRSSGYLDKINNSTARMINLVRDVLTYSQLSKERLASEPVDLKNTIDAIRMDYELMIEQKHVQIIYDELPVIEAIPLQMSQLFSNIISNALKFLRSDADPLIVITARRADKEILQHCSLPMGNDTVYYRIEIKDNGIGFDQRYAVQIFNIFQRLHGKTDYKGTGIGLAMCKKIVQNHHGSIYAESEPGRGATFTVILPVRQRFE
jgi:signal transduction histidine kinase